MRAAQGLRAAATSLALLTAGTAAACSGGQGLALPTASDLEGLYGPDPEVTLNGNVVDVRVVQPASQLARGGTLWARVGPYIYLFSPQTQELFEGYTGLAAVRVRTLDSGGERVAEALLERGTLNSLTWPRARQLVGRARLEGTTRPSYMIDLVRYGEEHAGFTYNSRYVGTQP
ncbi:MAG: hypothetical protein ACE5JR_08175 [Gemmatimonadota bacterium]